MAKKPKPPEEPKIETPDSVPNNSPPANDNPNIGNIDTIVSEHRNDIASETPTIPASSIDNVVNIPKKRGRPFGSKNRPRDGSVSTPRQTGIAASQLLPRPVVKALNAVPYSFIAKKYGEHWNLDDAEAESLVDVSLALADKYLPDVIKQNPELYAFAIMHGMIVFAKMEMQFRLMQQKKQNKAASIPMAEKEANPSESEDNTFSGKDGVRQEFSRFGLHDPTTTRDNL